MDEQADYEPVDWGPRYVLGATDDHYGVWDKKAAASGPLARFPLDDAGLEAAELLFWQLSRADRRQQDRLPTILFWSMLGAVGAWVVSGLILALVSPGPFDVLTEGSEGVQETFAVLHDSAYRVWIGAFAGLAGVWLYRTAGRLGDRTWPPESGPPARDAAVQTRETGPTSPGP